jgi:cytochrome c oxidase assembly protein subunit 15
MNPNALFDLTPVLHVMLMGGVVALGPLSWIWLRHRQAQTVNRLQALTLLTLFLTFDLVLFGAFTRLSDSGLGCPDWPGCYGFASPVGAQDHIGEAQAAMPTGPVTHGKAWIEMIHRYLATAVGVLIVVLAAAALWLRRVQPALGLAWFLPVLTLLWVLLQGAFGALTVTMKLFPAIVSLHLLAGMGLLVLLCLQWARYQQTGGQWPPVDVSTRVKTGLLVSALLLLMQLALGAWVSTNYAVLACSEFPKCQSSWWPVMDFSQGFSVWRALGLTADGQPIDFAALTAIHYVHRLMAYAVLAVLALLAWQLKKFPALKLQALVLAGLLWLQFLTGLSNVVLDWPMFAAILHTGGAAALVLVLTTLAVRVWPLARAGKDLVT